MNYFDKKTTEEPTKPEVEELANLYLDGELSDSDALLFEELRKKNSCAQEITSQLELLLKGAKSLKDEFSLNSSLKLKLREHLKEEVGFDLTSERSTIRRIK